MAKVSSNTVDTGRRLADGTECGQGHCSCDRRRQTIPGHWQGTVPESSDDPQYHQYIDGQWTLLTRYDGAVQWRQNTSDCFLHWTSWQNRTLVVRRNTKMCMTVFLSLIIWFHSSIGIFGFLLHVVPITVKYGKACKIDSCKDYSRADLYLELCHHFRIPLPIPQTIANLLLTIDPESRALQYEKFMNETIPRQWIIKRQDLLRYISE